MPRIIAISNHKGGVGKTTTAANLGFALSEIGQRVLLVDLDPQANLTNILMPEPPTETITDVLQNPNKKLNIIELTESLDFVPAAIALTKIDDYLNQRRQKEYTLKKIISRYAQSYDFVLLDCAPAMSTVTINALICASEVFTPITADALSIYGLNAVSNLIATVNQQYHENLKLSGILITRFNSRKKINNTIENHIKSQFGEIVFNTKIRENVSIQESQLYKQNIFDYAPTSNGAVDYKNLAREVVGM